MKPENMRDLAREVTRRTNRMNGASAADIDDILRALADVVYAWDTQEGAGEEDDIGMAPGDILYADGEERATKE